MNTPKAVVAVDFFTIEQRNFLVTVDDWSNLCEVDQVKSAEAPSVVVYLKRHFARHGIPMKLSTTMVPDLLHRIR